MLNILHGFKKILQKGLTKQCRCATMRIRNWKHLVLRSVILPPFIVTLYSALSFITLCVFEGECVFVCFAQFFWEYGVAIRLCLEKTSLRKISRVVFWKSGEKIILKLIVLFLGGKLICIINSK